MTVPGARVWGCAAAAGRLAATARRGQLASVRLLGVATPVLPRVAGPPDVLLHPLDLAPLEKAALAAPDSPPQSGSRHSTRQFTQPRSPLLPPPGRATGTNQHDGGRTGSSAGSEVARSGHSTRGWRDGGGALAELLGRWGDPAVDPEGGAGRDLARRAELDLARSARLNLAPNAERGHVRGGERDFVGRPERSPVRETWGEPAWRQTPGALSGAASTASPDTSPRMTPVPAPPAHDPDLLPSPPSLPNLPSLPSGSGPSSGPGWPGLPGWSGLPRNGGAAWDHSRVVGPPPSATWPTGVQSARGAQQLESAAWVRTGPGPEAVDFLHGWAERIVEDVVEAVLRRDLERHGLDPHAVDGGVP